MCVAVRCLGWNWAPFVSHFLSPVCVFYASAEPLVVICSPFKVCCKIQLNFESLRQLRLEESGCSIGGSLHRRQFYRTNITRKCHLDKQPLLLTGRVNT